MFRGETKKNKKNCVKCNKEVPDEEIISFQVQLKGGATSDPQAFEHKNCGGEILIQDT